MLCGPTELSVAATVALPAVKEIELNTAPPSESVRLTVSEKLVAMLLNWSSAVIDTWLALPAGRLVGEALTTRCVAAAAFTDNCVVAFGIKTLVESWAVIVCRPAVSSVPVAVATPFTLNGDKALIVLLAVTESVNVTLSPKLAIGLPKASSAVTEKVTLVVLLAVGVLVDSLISNWLGAAAVTVIGPVVPLIEAVVVSWAMID